MRCASFGLSVAAVLFGCTTVKLDYQRLPSPEALADPTRHHDPERGSPAARLPKSCGDLPFERAPLGSPSAAGSRGRGHLRRDAYTYASEQHAIES
jgi:hypothetical protein